MLRRNCCQCQIATDDFNRADSDSLGANWSEDGDGDIDGNQLLIPAAGGLTVLVFQTAHPGGVTANQRARVRFKLPSAGSADGSPYAGAIVGYADANHYLYCTVEGTTSAADRTAISLRLWQRKDSVETELQDPQTIIVEVADDGQFHVLELCYEPDFTYPYYSPGGVLRAKVTLASGAVWGSQAVGDFSFTGDQVGLRAQAGDTQGVIRFEDFYFGWMRDADAACKVQCADCNTPCPIGSDSFNYDWGADTDYGPQWSEISGAGWERVASELKLNSAGPGVILFKTFHPQIKTHHHVTCDVYCASGLKGRVIVNSKRDASSYHWAQLELSGTTLTLTIGKDGSTLDTQTAPFPAAAFVSVTVCYDGADLTATAWGMAATSSSTAVADGKYVGLAGNSAGGGERFDNFDFHKHRSFTDPADSDCPNCEEIWNCLQCDGGTAHTEWLVNIFHVANGACAHVTNAAVVNSAFIIRNALTDPVVLGACSHDGCNGDPPCCWSSGCMSGDATYQIGEFPAVPNGCCGAVGWVRLHTVSMRLLGSSINPGWVRIELHCVFAAENLSFFPGITFVLELPSLDCLNQAQTQTLADHGDDLKFCSPPQDSVLDVTNAFAVIRPL